MKKPFKTIAFTFVVLIGMLFSQKAFSQFTYFGLSTEYAVTTYHDYIFDNTRNHQFKMGLDLFVRPLRNFGIGANVSIPLAQSNSFSFDDAKTSEDYGSFYDFSDRYKPQDINYEIRHSRSATVFGRVYFETLINSFFDFGLSHFTITETFQFNRNPVNARYHSSGSLWSPAVESHYIYETYTRRVLAPVVGFGIQPHISKNVYINFTFNTTILPFSNQPTFKHVISFREDFDNSHEYVALQSQARNTKVIISPVLKVGFYL